MHTAVMSGVEMSEAARDADFSAYMAARQAALLRTAFLLTGDLAAAEDLVQSAFAKLYLSWDKVQNRESLDGYVRRIMINENNSLWRRAWKRSEVTTAVMPDRPVTDEYDEGRVAAVWELVRSLPRKQRAVIVLRYYEHLSEAEIAHTLGVSTGTVKSQASRALAALRERVPDALISGEEER
ncbi:Sigma-70, region 4 type 2 [metagenome]|uniref:Sigma-70, region 4 type 2 n=1 Tax=metagenome TaxID=256318 RepID=A0A2P2CBI1_9ZZZZ